MKWFLFTLLILQSLLAHATIRTVCNLPASLGQYSTIQSAIDASVNGDTILIQASTATYAGFNITSKRLVLIGPGFTPDVQVSQPAYISSNCNINGSGSSRTEIQGLYFLGDAVIIFINTSMDSLRFFRNYINGISFYSGQTYRSFTFSGNYFRASISTYQSVHQNFLFENNVFRAPGNCMVGFNSGLNNNILFNHNLFYSGSGSPVNTFHEMHYATFTNNIFVERNFNATVYQCSFMNNITFNCSPNNPWDVNGNINQGGNIVNMDPLMVDQVYVNNGTAHQVSDFTIAAGPANNAGTDAKDLGLLYDAIGGRNWIHGRNSRMPSVVSMVITNPVIETGGTLNINLSARKNE